MPRGHRGRVQADRQCEVDRGELLHVGVGTLFRGHRRRVHKQIGDATWTGAACCLKDWANCIDGAEAPCKQLGGQWTGAKCCVRHLCVPGSEDACTHAGETWMGSRCCLRKHRSCVDGTEVACKQAGAMWTGAKCCVATGADEACVDATEDQCKRSAGKWTGAKCCVR